MNCVYDCPSNTSNGDTIVSSDDAYADVTSRLDLKTVGEE